MRPVNRFSVSVSTFSFIFAKGMILLVAIPLGAVIALHLTLGRLSVMMGCMRGVQILGQKENTENSHVLWVQWGHCDNAIPPSPPKFVDKICCCHDLWFFVVVFDVPFKYSLFVCISNFPCPLFLWILFELINIQYLSLSVPDCDVPMLIYLCCSRFVVFCAWFLTGDCLGSFTQYTSVS